MIFTQTPLKGAYCVELERIEDDRGFLARSWCVAEFGKLGLNPDLVQCNVSFNNRKGTLRGMHFQSAPCEEAKLVRCTMGAIYDVVVDLRPGSPTFKQWYALEMTAQNRKAIYVPEGFAHGFQTLEDDTEVLYHMSEFFRPEHQTGVRYDDPAFGIEWPSSQITISSKDSSFPLFGDPA